MKTDKYTRNLALLCPTCGGSQFEIRSNIEESKELVRCICCDRELTKEELMHRNSSNIEAHTSEAVTEISNDIGQELKNELKKTFQGNKNIKIK